MKADAHSPVDTAGTFGELLRVALPLIVSSSASAVMYVLDRVFLSWYSVDAMAAALPSSVLHWNLASLGLGTISIVNAFVAQYHGANENQRIGPILWQGVYASLLFSIFVGVCAIISPQLFAWFGHAAEVQLLEIRYFNILCYGTFPMLLAANLACFYSGRGRTLTIMVASIVGNSIDIVLDYLMIFGRGGFPEMGIDGAALSSVIGFVVIAGIYLADMLWSERSSMYALFASWRLDVALFKRMLRFGLPCGIQQVLDIACWTIFVQLVGRLGSAPLAATSLVFNLNALVFVPLMGLGTAVAALVGQRIGDQRVHLAVRTTWRAFALATFYVLAVCGIYIWTPDLITRPYGLQAEQDDLHQLVVGLLKFVAIYSWFDGMTIVFSSAIRGAGDTRFAMWFSLSAGLLFLVLPTWWAASYASDGFWLSWYAVTVFIMILGLGFLARFQQGRWKSMRVIEERL